MVKGIVGYAITACFFDESKHYGQVFSSSSLTNKGIKSDFKGKNHKAHILQNIYYKDGIYVLGLSSSYDFDNITEPKTVNYTLFNASKNNQALKNTDMKGFAGLNIRDISIGDKIYSYEPKSFSLVALNSGDIELKAKLNLIFSDYNANFSFKGKRGTIFYFIPSQEYYEEKSLKTDIFTTLSGKEYRVALAKKCRINIGFKLFLKSSQSLNSCMELLSYAAKQNLLVPLWNSANIAPNDMQNTTNIPKGAYSEFEVGKFITIISPFMPPIFRKVIEINENTITIDDPADIKKGDIIAPLIKTTVSKQTNTKRDSQDLLELKLEFKEIE